MRLSNNPRIKPFNTHWYFGHEKFLRRGAYRGSKQLEKIFDFLFEWTSHLIMIKLNHRVNLNPRHNIKLLIILKLASVATSAEAWDEIYSKLTLLGGIEEITDMIARLLPNVDITQHMAIHNSTDLEHVMDIAAHTLKQRAYYNDVTLVNAANPNYKPCRGKTPEEMVKSIREKNPDLFHDWEK